MFQISIIVFPFYENELEKKLLLKQIGKNYLTNTAQTPPSLLPSRNQSFQRESKMEGLSERETDTE
jgi:hypothetical protein